jgi:hypothetical protein
MKVSLNTMGLETWCGDHRGTFILPPYDGGQSSYGALTGNMRDGVPLAHPRKELINAIKWKERQGPTMVTS